MSAWLDGLSSEEARSILKQLLPGNRSWRNGSSRHFMPGRGRAPCATASGNGAPLRNCGRLASEAERASNGSGRTRPIESGTAPAAGTYLATLAADFDRCWQDIDQKAERGIASAYEEATRALADLAEAYTLRSNRSEFDARLHGFMERHGKRTALVRRLRQAGLWR